MEIIQNIVEYYDELYTIDEAQKKFYTELINDYEKPAKLLRINCGTGYFEHYLAKLGHDVTGIETSRDLLKTANLRRRNQLMAIRFFEMSSLEMTRFLGKGFYNIISSLDGRIIFIHDRTLIRKFFHDSKELLSKDGTLILQLPNFKVFKQEPLCKLPDKESLRVKLYTEIFTFPDGTKSLQQNIETGNGKVLPVIESTRIYALTQDEIIEFAKESGFTKIEFYADFNKTPFDGTQEEMVVCLK